MTQRQFALQNQITKEMQQAAEYDNVSADFILEGLKKGTIVIPKNVNHNFPARAIGKGVSTKINANIGTSEICSNINVELAKLEYCKKYGADSVMDLSTGGDLKFIRKSLLYNSTLMLGTVPIYGVACKLAEEGKKIDEMIADLLFAEIEEQAEMGVDFITVHCGVTLANIEYLEDSDRTMGVVSRGGSLLKRWMSVTGNENPLFEQYDRLLDIAERHDVTLSLGDGLRPGGLADATDPAQISELLTLGGLVKRALDRGVQVMVEGPGHVPLNEVALNVQLQKKLCHDVPFYVLGPLVTDIAPGYDHITGAIGGAIAAASGADFLCYVTPAEHLCLPDLNDVKEGIIASKIAAHAGDLVKIPEVAQQRDDKMSEARKRLDWESMFKYAIDPEIAKERKSADSQGNKDYCTMCGELCAVKIDNLSRR